MLEIGTLLQNRYEIIQPIGQGGMGAVYLARDQRLGNTVALKETFFLDAVLLAAFEREAKLLAGLRHAALPKVIDHFADNRGQFLVMEYISGDDLHDVLQESGAPTSVEEALHWADQLLDALEYLHAQEPPIIHRDIKPQNLKLTSRNQVVLLDFGLAKGMAIERTHANSTSSIFGYTPSYAPLEQIQGSGTDSRSDLYSLAATLYHLLTGVKPVDALTRASNVLDGQPDPLRSASELNPHVPVRVSDVLLQGMALNKNLRLASATKMRELLRDAMRPNQAAASTMARSSLTESDQPNSPAALPGASTHILASAPATSAQKSAQPGSFATRPAATEMRGTTPARLKERSIPQARPGTVAQRRSATVEISSAGASHLPRLIAAGGILVIAIALVVFVFKRDLKRDDAGVVPAGVQKSEPATASEPSGSNAKTAVEEPAGMTYSPPANATSPPSATGATAPKSDDDNRREKEAQAGQQPNQEEPKPEDPNRTRTGVPAMQEAEGTKPIQRKPEEVAREEPKRQEPSPRQEPPPYPPPPDQYPPPPGTMPPPGGMPPHGGMPPPRRRP